MCNCNKKRQNPRPANVSASNRSPHTLTLDGQVSQFGSRLEAEAANVRAGGRGRVAPA